MPQKSSFGASMFQQKVPADEAMMMMVFVDTQKGALFFALLKSYRRTPPPRSKTTTLARVPQSSSSREREVRARESDKNSLAHVTKQLPLHIQDLPYPSV